MVVETDGCDTPDDRTSSLSLPLIDDHPFAIDEEVVELVQDAVRGHLSVESVRDVEGPLQLLLLAAGQRCDLVGFPHLFGGRSDSGVM